MNPVLRNDTPWLMTAAGTRFPLLAPQPSDTEPTHRAEMLAKRCRFGGATVQPWSVAEHAVLVSNIVETLLTDGHVAPRGVPVPTAALYALLHDDHEAYLGDMPTPVKWALRTIDPRAMDAWDHLVDGIDCAVIISHGLSWPVPADVRELVRFADMMALATEKRDLMPSPAPGHPDWDIELPEPWQSKSEPAINWRAASRLYLDRLEKLETWRRLAAA